MRRWLLGASLLLGCWDGGECAPWGPFSPGSYASQGGAWVNGRDTFPHDGGGNKTLTVERDREGNGIVRITYVRNGRTIVETWAMASDYGRPVRWEGQGN